MHSAFRVLGQQEGLQLIRGILPESIDVYLNNIIFETVRNELLANAKTVFQDNVNTQPTALGAINILRTLYRNKTITTNGFNEMNVIGATVAGSDVDMLLRDPEDESVILGIKDTLTDRAEVPVKIRNSNPKIGYYEIYIPNESSKMIGAYPIIEGTGGQEPPHVVSFDSIKPMMYLGVALQYGNETIPNLNIGLDGIGSTVGTRILGGDVLETTFRDYCNGATAQSPVVSLLSDENGAEYLQIYTNTPNLYIKSIVLKYIKLPDTVKFVTNPTPENPEVNCDLPSYIHYEIVRKAVALCAATIGGGNRQVQQNNQQNN